MPPALSDEETGFTSGEEELPVRGKGVVAVESESEPEAKNEDADDSEDEDGDDEVYIVERILTHRFRGAVLEYQVKWQGFEKKADLTWEPEDNLDGAQEIVNEYHRGIGGRPEAGKGKKRKGRKSGAEESASATPVASSKRAKQKVEWTPPPGSWENDVDFVDTVEQGEGYDDTGAPVRYAYLTWMNGKKTQHPLKHVYQKCPQKMLQYYESHLVFSPPKNLLALNGDSDLA